MLALLWCQQRDLKRKGDTFMKLCSPANRDSSNGVAAVDIELEACFKYMCELAAWYTPEQVGME